MRLREILNSLDDSVCFDCGRSPQEVIDLLEGCEETNGYIDFPAYMRGRKIYVDDGFCPYYLPYLTF